MVRLALLATLALGACSKPPHLELEIRDPLGLAADAVAVAVFHGGGWSVTASLDGESFPTRMTLHTEEAGRQVVLWVDALDAAGAPLARGNGLAMFPKSRRGSLSVDLLSLCSMEQDLVADISCALADPDPGVGKCFAGECLRSECGDGVVNEIDGEVCDDGNTIDGDGCSADCLRFQLCGDGYVDAEYGETCDDANLNPNDGCYVSLDPSDEHACTLRTYRSAVIAGAGVSEGNPIEHRFVLPVDVEVGPLGTEWYVADSEAARIYKITPDPSFWAPGAFGSFADARFAPVAGTGVSVAGPFGDGGPAGAARLIEPVGLAVDSLGDVYIADRGAHCIRRFDHTLRIDTVAGLCGLPRDGSAPDEPFRLDRPVDVAVDGTGTIYYAEEGGWLGRIVVGSTFVEHIHQSAIDRTIKAVAVDAAGEELAWVERSPPTCPSGCMYDMWLLRAKASDLVAGGVVDPVETPITSSLQFVCGPGDAECLAAYALPVDLVIDGEAIFVSEPLRGQVFRVTGAAVEEWAGIGMIDPPLGCGAGCALGTSLRPVGLARDPQGGMLVTSPLDREVYGVEDDVNDTRRITAAAGFPTRPVGEGSLATSVPLEVVEYRGAFSLGAIGTAPLPEMFFASGSERRVRHVAAYPEIVSTALEPNVDTGFLHVGGMAYLPGGELLVASWGSGDLIEVTWNGLAFEDTALLTNVLGAVEDLHAAADGWVYVYHSRMVSRVRPDGSEIEGLAGTGSLCATPPACGDGGSAASANLAEHGRVVVTSNGDIFVTDPELGTVRRIYDDGIELKIERFAGGGGACAGALPSCADNQQASAVDLASPVGIAVASGDRLFVSTADDGVLWRIDTDGSIHWVAGVGDGSAASGDGGPPRAAGLGQPSRVAWLDAGGDVLFVLARDSTAPSAGDAARVRRIAPSVGSIETVIGAVDAPGNGLVNRSGFAAPSNLAALFVPDCTDPDPVNCQSTAYLVTDPPTGQVRLLDLASPVFHVRSVVGYPGGDPSDGAPARHAALLARPTGVAFAPEASSLFIAETGGHAILRVRYDLGEWPMTTFAGLRGTPGAIDGSVGRFEHPMGLAIHHRSQTLYVADTGNHAVRAIDLTNGAISTVVGVLRQRGPPSQGRAGDVHLNAPEGICVVNRPTELDSSFQVRDGALFIADTGNHVVHLVTPELDLTGEVTADDWVRIVAGTGEPSNVDMGIDTPRGLTTDSVGNLYIAAHGSIRLLPYYDDTTSVARPGLYPAAGVVADYFGTPVSIYGPDVTAGEYPAAVTQCLTGLALTTYLDGGQQWVIALDGCTGLVVALQPEFNAPADPPAGP